NARTFLLHEVLHPRKELVGVERLLKRERDRLHLLVVIMLEAAAMVAMVVVMMIMVMMVIMAVIMRMIVTMLVMFGLQELRLDLENTVEVERVAAQHLGQRDLAALGGVQLGVGIDAADAGLDIGKLL